jgi:hypothetical protein
MATQSDFLVVKYNPAGEQQWTRAYNGPGNGRDVPTALKLDRQGNVIITGTSDGLYGSTYQDIATVKINPSGEELWVARYSGPENESDEGTSVGQRLANLSAQSITSIRNPGPRAGGFVDGCTIPYLVQTIHSPHPGRDHGNHHVNHPRM